jgi:anti-sigma B factor antagonist
MNAKAGLEIAREGNVAIASFASSCICDVEEITNASTQLRQFIEAHRPARMVFDFAGVKFFSSQVLGLLLEARARLEPYQADPDAQRRCRVAITSLSPQLERVFRITNLDKIFDFYPDRTSAIEQPSDPWN